MHSKPQQQEEEVSLVELIAKLKNLCAYLAKRSFLILIIGMVGAAAGFLYAWLYPVKYMSRLSFVVEESKAGGGGLAALAGQFGFDLGAGGGGIFSGDNVLLFLKSESLCRETLLTKYDSAGNETLADRYAAASKLKAKWTKDDQIGEINFSKFKDGKLPRIEDSLMQLITKRILEKDLSVSKPDKKASFIEVRVSTKDELLSKYLSDRLVKIATDRFIESKTKHKAINVAKLQHRADSLGALLNSKTYTAASSQQNLLDVNPGFKIAPVAAEITARDKTMIATIFAEVVKNLEIAKVALSQETPNIEIVDYSSLPLKKDKVSKAASTAGGGLLAIVLCIIFLVARKWWKQLIEKQSSTENTSLVIPAKNLTTS